MPGGQTHYTDEFRVYRSASLSTGSSGSYVQLPFDGQSALVDQSTLSLSGGNVLMNVFGIVCIGYAITCTAASGLTRIKVRVTRDPGGAREVIVAEHAHVAQAADGDFTVTGSDIMCDVIDTDTIQIDIASVGAGSVSVTTGNAATWASFLVVL